MWGWLGGGWGGGGGGGGISSYVLESELEATEYFRILQTNQPLLLAKSQGLIWISIYQLGHVYSAIVPMPQLQNNECLYYALPYYAQFSPSGSLPELCRLGCSVNDVFKIAGVRVRGTGWGGHQM